jgi:hypothetical protein
MLARVSSIPALVHIRHGHGDPETLEGGVVISHGYRTM